MDNKETKKRILVGACFISSLVMGIVNYSVPFIYPLLVEKFDSFATVASGALAVFICLGHFLGKIFHRFNLFYLYCPCHSRGMI